MNKISIFKSNKKLLLSLALPVTILSTNTSEVRSEFYFTGNYGTQSFTSADWKATVNDLAHKGDISFDDGTGWEGGLGYDFGWFRTEVSYGKSTNEIEGITAEIDEGPLSGTAVASSASGDLKVNNILINGYIDFPLGKKLTPYIGGGLGASKLDIDNIIVDGEVLESANTWLFGYQGKLGVNYALTKSFNVFGEGTYSVFSDMGVAGDEYALESSSDINYRAGVTLKF